MEIAEAVDLICTESKRNSHNDSKTDKALKQIADHPEMAKTLSDDDITSLLTDPQSRKWHIVINNPQKYCLDHNAIKDKLKRHNLLYYCMMDEIGNNNTPHTHLYIYSSSPIRFTTIKNDFLVAHIEKAYGSSEENRTYIRKEGKFKDSEKGHTSVEGTFEEAGIIPTKTQESNDKFKQIHRMIDEGFSNLDIINEYPDLSFKIRMLIDIRNEYLKEKNKTNFRKLNVTYLYGKTGTGKTYSIFQKFRPDQICRVTNYQNPKALFDAYEGQEVLVFEEFRSQIPLADMLNYLDVYPIDLPARYGNRWASYTTVFITSNIPLDEQYESIQEKEPESWNAFTRRIHNIAEFTALNEFNVEKGSFQL